MIQNDSPLESGGKRILFIDRDGTMIQEFPPTYQIDSFNKLSFYPYVFKYLGKITVYRTPTVFCQWQNGWAFHARQQINYFLQ